MRGRLNHWRSRACARLLAAAAAAALALPLAATAADVLNVHDFREVLWSQGHPRTAEDIVRLKEIGVEWEKVTRKPVLDEVDTWLIENKFHPPVSSGTPPHSAGSSGVFTDIDHSFATLEDAQAAARHFEELGYTVEWNAVDTFSVKELDYTGFANTRPRMAPGSPEEVKFLRDATRFPDKLWTRGSQEWVEGAKVKARIDIRNTRKGELVKGLADLSLGDAERLALQSELDDVERSLAALGDELTAVKVTDRTGFTVDMFKKAAHHVDPSKWCPVPNGFGCWEDPRQAAKAAGRALKEMPGTLSEAQQERLAWLEDIAKGKKVLPGEGAELEALKEKLLIEINRSMSEAYETSVAADAAFDQALVSEYEAAVASGDAAAISRARIELAKRQLTSRRIEATLQGIVEGEGAEASKVVHEWVTGERLRPVERPGKAPVYEVVEETAEGLKVVGTRTAAEVNETALKAVEEASLRTAGKWSHPLGGYEPPSFSSVSPEGMTLAGQVKHGIKNVGPFTLLLAAYGAYAGGKESVEMLDEHTEMKVLSASDFGDWRNITAEKVGGWATATTLGTVLAVSELTGVSHVGRAVAGAETTTDKIAAGGYATCQVLMVCMAHELGEWYSGEAIQAELKAAGREGRPASRARMAANLVGQVPFTRLGERMGKAIAEWGKQRFTEIVAYGGSELAARRSEAASSEIAAQLEAALGANGMDALAEHLTDLRLRTAALEQTWAAGTGALDRAILGRQDVEILMEALRPVPDFGARCQALIADLGEDASQTAVKEARADWEKELEAYAGKVRRALEAAVETLGEAVTAANVFGDVSMWESGLADQGAVQRSLAGRFGRLTVALPDNEALAAWRTEINSTANPVPLGLRPDLAKEARSIAFEAEKAIRELAALLKLEIPPCDLPEPEEETPVAAVPPESTPVVAAGEPAPPVFKLVSIRGIVAPDVHFTEGQAGFWKREELRYFDTGDLYLIDTSSLKLEQFPLEIVLGEPFEVSGEAKKRNDFQPTFSCRGVTAPAGTWSWRGPEPEFSAAPVGSGFIGASGTDTIHFKGEDNLSHPCGDIGRREEPFPRVDDFYDLKSSASEEFVVEFRVRFLPEEPESDEKKTVYNYRVEISGPTSDTPSGLGLPWPHRYQTDSSGFLPSEVSWSSADWPRIHVSVGVERGSKSIVLEYRPVHGEDPVITSVDPYEHPAVFDEPLTGGTPGGAVAETGSNPESGGDESGTGPGGGDEARTTGTTGTASLNPADVNPGGPEVAGHIRQWLATAQPPQNAVPGGNWHYDKYGRVVGSGPGLRTASTHDAVDYGGGTPEETAWSLRKELDSIDHCTLEEYVVARLEQRSVSQCAGRYGGVKDLRGVKLAAAKAAVANNGFSFTLAPGSPAKTPADEGTIERQEPGPEQYLQKGATVKLFVHAPYVAPGSVLPAFTGKPVSEAKSWLQENDFDVQLRPGRPAPSAELAGTVEAQEPAAGTKLLKGAKVTLAVHSAFIDTRQVPVLVSQPLGTAKELLRRQGLEYTLKPGSPAPSADRSGTIEAQDPVSGAQVAAGSKIALTVYSNFIDAGQVPNVQGLAVSKAKEQLQAAGFTVSLLPGPPAPTPSDSGRVVEQQPAAGASVSRGSQVAVKVYSPYVATGRESPDAGRQADARPGGNGCPPGMLMGTKPGSWGQEEACVPAGTTGNGGTGSGNNQNASKCTIDVTENIHNNKYFYVTTRGKDNYTGQIDYHVTTTGVPFTPQMWSPGTQQIGGTFYSKDEALRKARELCPNGKIYGKGYSY